VYVSRLDLEGNGGGVVVVLALAAVAKFSTEADAVFAPHERMNDLQATIQKTKNENGEGGAA
jgi:hypothetical protein